ncbi:phosphoribosylglycinamide formyltransferase [Candidatus Kaiserbacteria bacterium]|nr:phosphoribosylglycinamide formyltransferase [Candidatus Kaiserbacteria bacterium]
MPKLAVLVSGQGTLLKPIVDAETPVGLVLADRKCPGLYWAQEAKIPTELVERKDFTDGFDHAEHTAQVLGTLLRHRITHVAMAGYKTLLSEALFSHYAGKILNTHPSLLPAFKGNHAVRDTLAYGAKITGCTVHIATAEMDAGPILAQEHVRVEDGDTEETLHARIKAVESWLYPLIIRQQLKRA